MPATRAETIAYGSEQLAIRVPERTRTVTARRPLPPVPDIEQAVRDAISEPIAHDPLTKLVGPKAKVTIAFDDASGSYFQTRRADLQAGRNRGHCRRATQGRRGDVGHHPHLCPGAAP